MIKNKKIKIDNIYKFTPEKIAKNSYYVQDAYKYVLEKTSEIKNKTVKRELKHMLDNPLPSFLYLYEDKDERKKLYETLCEGNYLYEYITVDNFMPQQFFLDHYKIKKPLLWAAPGSGYRGHHAHPGGLVLHMKENLEISLSLANEHEKIYDIEYDKDMIIFAQMAHDIAKAWIIPWLDDMSCLPQYPIAETGGHHIFSLAESIYRKMPLEYIFAQASTHVNPSNKKAMETIQNFIRAACIIARTTPQQYGFVDIDGNPLFNWKLMEYWYCYMGDHSVVFTVHSSRKVIKALKIIAAEKYGFSEDELEGERFNYFRNYVLGKYGATKLYSIFAQKGVKGVRKEIASLFKN